MRRVRSKNTKPEIAVRKLLHGLGYRYRLHAEDLPGKPDIVFRKRHKIIFVHGCFWHQHEGCSRTRIPKSNREYWERKLNRNRERDKENAIRLREMGYEVHVVWGCELGDIDALLDRLVRFLG